mmetsp:Transcript_11472/g.48135  ORF Transcript_11472/g.48135 Transcript_11472/m.48135 type:complete len:209 (+) Transcript_11472:253-879(+)
MLLAKAGLYGLLRPPHELVQQAREGEASSDDGHEVGQVVGERLPLLLDDHLERRRHEADANRAQLTRLVLVAVRSRVVEVDGEVALFDRLQHGINVVLEGHVVRASSERSVDEARAPLLPLAPVWASHKRPHLGLVVFGELVAERQVVHGVAQVEVHVVERVPHGVGAQLDRAGHLLHHHVAIQAAADRRGVVLDELCQRAAALALRC